MIPEIVLTLLAVNIDLSRYTLDITFSTVPNLHSVNASALSVVNEDTGARVRLTHLTVVGSGHSTTIDSLADSGVRSTTNALFVDNGLDSTTNALFVDNGLDSTTNAPVADKGGRRRRRGDIDKKASARVQTATVTGVDRRRRSVTVTFALKDTDAFLIVQLIASSNTFSRNDATVAPTRISLVVEPTFVLSDTGMPFNLPAREGSNGATSMAVSVAPDTTAPGLRTGALIITDAMHITIDLLFSEPVDTTRLSGPNVILDLNALVNDGVTATLVALALDMSTTVARVSTAAVRLVLGTEDSTVLYSVFTSAYPSLSVNLRVTAGAVRDMAGHALAASRITLTVMLPLSRTTTGTLSTDQPGTVGTTAHVQSASLPYSETAHTAPVSNTGNDTITSQSKNGSTASTTASLGTSVQWVTDDTRATPTTTPADHASPAEDESARGDSAVAFDESMVIAVACGGAALLGVVLVVVVKRQCRRKKGNGRYTVSSSNSVIVHADADRHGKGVFHVLNWDCSICWCFTRVHC